MIVAGNVELSRLLLEFGADYSSYLSGTASLIIAVNEEKPAIIRLLVEFGMLMKCLYLSIFGRASIQIILSVLFPPLQFDDSHEGSRSFAIYCAEGLRNIRLF